MCRFREQRRKILKISSQSESKCYLEVAPKTPKLMLIPASLSPAGRRGTEPLLPDGGQHEQPTGAACRGSLGAHRARSWGTLTLHPTHLGMRDWTCFQLCAPEPVTSTPRRGGFESEDTPPTHCETGQATWAAQGFEVKLAHLMGPRVLGPRASQPSTGATEKQEARARFPGPAVGNTALPPRHTGHGPPAAGARPVVSRPG